MLLKLFLYRTKNNKFNKKNFNGLKKLSHYLVTILRFLNHQLNPKNNFLNMLKKLTKNNITTIYIQYVGYDTKPIKEVHSCYIWLISKNYFSKEHPINLRSIYSLLNRLIALKISSRFIDYCALFFIYEPYETIIKIEIY